MLTGLTQMLDFYAGNSIDDDGETGTSSAGDDAGSSGQVSSHPAPSNAGPLPCATHPARHAGRCLRWLPAAAFRPAAANVPVLSCHS